MKRTFDEKIERFSVWLLVSYIFGLATLFSPSDPVFFNFDFQPLVMDDYYFPNLEVETFRDLDLPSPHALYGKTIPDLESLIKIADMKGQKTTVKMTSKKSSEALDKSDELPRKPVTPSPPSSLKMLRRIK